MAKSVPWTKEQVEFLKENYNKWHTQALAKEFGRSEAAVRMKALKLGLATPKGSYPDLSPEEVEYILENYEATPTIQIAEVVGISESRIRRFAMSRGLTKKRPWEWTNEEVAFLKDNYQMSYQRLEEHIGKPRINIRKKIRELGLKKTGNQGAWAKIDLDYLKENHGKVPIKNIAKTIHRSEVKVREKCFELGLEERVGRNDWEQWEVDFLIENHGKMTIEEIQNKLNRNRNSILSKRKKMGLLSYRENIDIWHDLIVKLALQKKTLREISEAIGQSQRDVKWYALQQNIDIVEDAKILGSTEKAKEYGIFDDVDLSDENLTVCQWYAYWFRTFREPEIAEVTKEKYRLEYCYLYELGLGKMKLMDVRRTDIQNYMNVYGEKFYKVTVTGHAQKLKALFNDAMYEGLISTNPAGNIKLIYKEQKMTVKERKTRREVKKHLEREEYQKLKFYLVFGLAKKLNESPKFSATHAHYPEQILETVIFIALKTGARFSEILGLTEEDIDVDRKLINIDKTWDYKTSIGFKPTKNVGSIREVLVDDELIETLRKYFDWLKDSEIEIDSGTLFNIKNFKLFNNTVNDHLERILKGLDIEPITLHKLRHTHASILISSEVPVDVVAKRLGHSSTEMIQRVYGHLLKDTEEHGNRMILNLI